jgi:hypothetical protein
MSAAGRVMRWPAVRGFACLGGGAGARVWLRDRELVV